jgi:hypothetical protein
MLWNRHLTELLIFNFFLPWTSLSRSSKLMKTVTSVFEVQWRWCTGLHSVGYDFSPLNYV